MIVKSRNNWVIVVYWKLYQSIMWQRLLEQCWHAQQDWSTEYMTGKYPQYFGTCPFCPRLKNVDISRKRAERQRNESSRNNHSFVSFQALSWWRKSRLNFKTAEIKMSLSCLVPGLHNHLIASFSAERIDITRKSRKMVKPKSKAIFSRATNPFMKKGTKLKAVKFRDFID